MARSCAAYGLANPPGRRLGDGALIASHAQLLQRLASSEAPISDTGPGLEAILSAARRLDRMVGDLTEVAISITDHGVGMPPAEIGRIWVESEPGKGSTFSFTLPLA